MANSLYTLALDFSKELNYTKAIMARQGDKGITIEVRPFLSGLKLDTTGATFTLKGTTPKGKYVESVATSVTADKIVFSLDGTFMSESGYYENCYVEYKKGNQILTTQDIIFFSLGVSDISQGQADEYVSQLEELIRKYNETFDAFMAEIEGRVDSLNQQITDLTGQAKTLQDKLDQLKEEISKLGNLHVMYSNSTDFGDYDYSGNPNIAPNVGFNDFYNNGSQTGYTAKDGVDHIAVTKTADVSPAGKLVKLRTLLPNKTYTLSVDIWADREVPSGAIDCGIQLKEGRNVRTVWALIGKPVSTNRTTHSVTFTTAANFVSTEESIITFWFGNSAGECTGYLGYNIKIEEGSTATPYQPNLLDAPYYLSKVPLGENLFSTKDWQNRPPFSVGGIAAMKILVKPRTEYIMSTNIPTYALNGLYDLFVFNSDGTPSSITNGVALNQPRKVTTLDDGVVIVAMRGHDFSSGSVWAKLEKGDTPTPNISEYKYRGIGMRDSNNPKDYVWDIEPNYVEENLATDIKIAEITGKANDYTDQKVSQINSTLTRAINDTQVYKLTKNDGNGFRLSDITTAKASISGLRVHKGYIYLSSSEMQAMTDYANIPETMKPNVIGYILQNTPDIDNGSSVQILYTNVANDSIQQRMAFRRVSPNVAKPWVEVADMASINTINTTLTEIQKPVKYEAWFSNGGELRPANAKQRLKVSDERLTIASKMHVNMNESPLAWNSDRTEATFTRACSIMAEIQAMVEVGDQWGTWCYLSFFKDTAQTAQWEIGYGMGIASGANYWFRNEISASVYCMNAKVGDKFSITIDMADGRKLTSSRLVSLHIMEL